MAVITNNTFDPTRQYTSVRLQQGVPLVDADWNEGQDALKFAIQALTRWFVGDGVPAGNDGFRIAGTGLANDFIIRSGITGTADVLGNAGHLIVGGWDTFILADVNFTAQPLHASQGGSATDLAARLNVPVIAALTTPAANGEVLAYVDVWEHLVMPTDDTSLLLPGLGGTESCARIRREWAVRVRDGANLPQPSDGPPLYQPGHQYAALARIARRSGDNNVNANDVTDRRTLNLTLAAAINRLANLERLLLQPVLETSPADFSPRLGAPGTSVTIRGRNLNISAPTVRFGATPATLLAPPTDNQLLVAAPVVPPGGVFISVETLGGTVTSSATFNVLASAPAFGPSGSQFTPVQGLPGVNITLNGQNFNFPPVIVRFGPTVGTIVGTPTATQIVATVPNRAPGAVPIQVQTAGGQISSTDSFLVLAPPTFDAPPNDFSPRIGAAGTPVQLRGNNFNLGTVTVQFDSTDATIVGTPTATRINVTVPAMAAGAARIRVTTAGGSVLSTDPFTVL